jgi:hypothetical protein
VNNYRIVCDIEQCPVIADPKSVTVFSRKAFYIPFRRFRLQLFQRFYYARSVRLVQAVQIFCGLR